MTLVPALPPRPRMRPTAVTFSCRTRLTGHDNAAFVLSAAAQRKFFDAELSGWSAGVLIGRGDARGRAVLTAWETPAESGLKFDRLVRGTVLVRFLAEDALLPGASYSGECEIVSYSNRTVVLELPVPDRLHVQRARANAALSKMHQPL